MTPSEKIQAPRGTYDILPDYQKYWQFVYNKFINRCQNFNFAKIDTPIFEYSNIFTRGIGETSDIVNKEMFYISRKDSDETDLVLRPEGTAGIVRSFVEQGMQNMPFPVKLYYYGPMFRYSRPQAGRFRQFAQVGFEIFGETDPASDVLTILISYGFFQDLKIAKNLVLEINSIGCPKCQKVIKKQLIHYFNQYKEFLCPECLTRLSQNPLRILDCKEKRCQSLVQSGPQIIDNLCEECNEHFKKVLEGLDELSIPYDLNPRLVRGLDYYTKTVFEFRDKNDEGRQASLGGGGRYDDLVENYGGPKTAAVGFAAGLERIIDKLTEYQVKIPQSKNLDVFVVQLGEKAKKMVLTLVKSLNEMGFSTNCAFDKNGLKAQMKTADRFGATVAVIIGQREALDKTVILRNMQEGSQQTVKIEKIAKAIKKELAKKV